MYYALFIALPFFLISHAFFSNQGDFAQKQLNQIRNATESASEILSVELDYCSMIFDNVLSLEAIIDQSPEMLASIFSGETKDGFFFKIWPWDDNETRLKSSSNARNDMIMLADQTEGVLLSDFRYLNDERISGISLIKTVNLPSGLHVAQLFVSSSRLTKILKPLRCTTLSEFFIVSKQGEMLVRTDDGITGISMAGFDVDRLIESKQWEGMYNNIPVEYTVTAAEQYYLISLTPIVEIYSDEKSRDYFLLTVLLVLLLGGSVLITLILKSIKEPIQLLFLSMREVEKGHFDSVIVYKKQNEFGNLIESYHRMLERIQVIINEMLRLEKTKRQAQNLARVSEIKALQAQINPHMLYNTLDSISWLAISYGARDISKIIRKLADYFRYSLSKGNDFIPFGVELKQMDSYLSIQQLRLGDRLEYSIDFPDDLLQCMTLKLIIQPFVENCIVHAFSNSTAHGIIRIKGERVNDTVKLTISDNGSGADIQKMSEYIRNDGSQTEHYGMRNVAERIHLCYGERYGISFAHNDSGGLDVIMCLPYTKKERKFND